MRKLSAYFAPALLFCLLALAAPSPVTVGRAQTGVSPAERCSDCLSGVQARYDQCLAQFGDNNDPRGQRCHDQFNEGIVQCHRNFCEQ